jgi:hypothetical protein
MSQRLYEEGNRLLSQALTNQYLFGRLRNLLTKHGHSTDGLTDLADVAARVGWSDEQIRDRAYDENVGEDLERAVRVWIAKQPATAEPKANTDEPEKQPTANDRMMAIFTRDKRCIDWSGSEWAKKLGVSKSTITGTKAWQAVMKEREDRKKALRKAGYVK